MARLGTTKLQSRAVQTASRAGFAGGASSRPRGLRVAIAGAGRTRHGTGPFVARRLIESGAEVVGVSTTSLTTAYAAAGAVEHLAERPCAAFAGVAEMISATGPDALAICSPAPAHAEHLSIALSHRLDTFCEKPLLAPDDNGLDMDLARRLVAGFEARGVVLHVNTQWVRTLPDFLALHGLGALPRLERLQVELEPPLGGRAIVTEALPHANSLLLALSPEGRERDLRLRFGESGETLEVTFDWLSVEGRAEVRYLFRTRIEQPRAAAFEVNSMRVERRVDVTAGYTISLVAKGASRRVTDPLATSVAAFLADVGTQAGPDRAILRNLGLMGTIWNVADAGLRSGPTVEPDHRAQSLI